MVSPASDGSQKYEAYQELVKISRENGKGENVTKEEFSSLKDGGHLDGWISEYDLSFSDLDLNNSGRISTTDGSRLKDGVQTRSSRSDEGSGGNSYDMVVIQFGWSDTSVEDTMDALSAAGIDSSDYKMSNSGHDKGVGIAVVPRDQAEWFKEQYSGGKTFVHIHDTVDGVDDIDDLIISFEVSDSRNSIDFGGGAYGALMTDDPANKTSGSDVQGTQTGSDSFWSVSDGDRGSAKMYEERGAPNGKQYVKMHVTVR